VIKLLFLNRDLVAIADETDENDSAPANLNESPAAGLAEVLMEHLLQEIQRQEALHAYLGSVYY
jgi:hypothetical protein